MKIKLHRKYAVLFLLILCTVGSVSQTVEIVKEPRDTSVVVGQDVTLECIVENLGQNSMIQWTKGDFALGFDRSLAGFPRYSITGDESIGEYNLLIKNSTIEDEDEYECQVTSHRLRSRAAMVTIQVPPKGPAIDDAINNVINVRAHSENLITCRSWNGKPVATLTWYKDQVQVRSNVTYAITDESHALYNASATLRLWPTEADDGVKFYCAMSSEVITDTVPVDAMVSLNVQKPPIARVTVYPSNEIKVGQTLTALCDSGDSKPSATSYAWYSNGVVIPGQTDERITFENVQKDRNGEVISCQAINRVGSSPISSSTLNVLYSPILISAPQLVSVNISQKAVFNCEFEANPQPTVTWYKVREGGNVMIGSGSNLEIESTQQSDAGEIMCVARADKVESNSASTTLIVYGPPIIEASEVQYLKVGAEVDVIECTISSDPGIGEVTWSWGRGDVVYYIIDNSSIVLDSKAGLTVSTIYEEAEDVKFRGEFIQGSKVAKLFVYNVSPNDIDEYNCTVSNGYGTNTEMILVEEPIIVAKANANLPIILGVTFGILLIIIILIFVACCMRSYQTKSTTLYHDSGSSGYNGGAKDKTATSNDPDSDNPSTTSSVSSPGDRDDVFIHDNEVKSSQHHHDDGYHTEEANSCNKIEKSPLLSSNSNYQQDQETPLLQPQITTSQTQFRPQEIPSPQEYVDYYADNNYEPFLQSDVNDDHIMDNIPSGYIYTNNPTQNPYPSLGRTHIPMSYAPIEYMQSMHVHSNSPSVVSSHRSAAAPPYVPNHHMIGRTTPTPSQLLHRYAAPPVHKNYHDHIGSSTSSLDKTSSVFVDHFDNSSKISQPSTRLSQASRSSEMFQRPLTARMATHV